MNAPRFVPPFGWLEQWELEALPREATPLHIAALVVLRTRANGDGWTTDRIETLAEHARMSHASMKRALDWLADRKLVLVERRRAKGGQRGLAWWWRRRALGFDEWPQELRSGNTSSREEARRKSSTSRSAARGKRSSQRPEEEVRNEGRGGHGTRDNPDVLPESFPMASMTPEHVLERMDPAEAERVRAYERRRLASA